MVDVLRKRVAPAHRVLIDGKAFLNTTINPAVMYFTPGQIELMRNLMQYANRRETFVSDYYIGYYLIPTDADWNLIQQEVADLEETLMGNNNILWGYSDQYYDVLQDLSMPAGVQDMYGSVVPAGEVWEVTGMSFIHSSATINRVRIGFLDGALYVTVGEVMAPAASTLYSFNMDAILKEGDKLYYRFYNLTLDDDVYGWAWGSKMEVPT